LKIRVELKDDDGKVFAKVEGEGDKLFTATDRPCWIKVTVEHETEMGCFGFKPLDGLIDELKAKYCMKDDDVQRLIEVIQKYLAYVEEAWEQAEIGEI